MKTMKELGFVLGIAMTCAVSQAQLLNGNFEAGSGANADNWTKFGAVNRETWAQNTNGPAGNGMAFEWWVGTNGGFYQDVVVSAGSTVAVAAWAQDDAASVTTSVYSMKLEWLDSTLTNIINTVSNSISGLVNASFTQISMSPQVAPVGTAQVRLVFQGENMTNGEALKIDDVTLTVIGSPIITNHPTSQTVFAGANATFTVGVSNTAGAFYQWQLNNVSLTNGGSVSGATSAALTITGVAVGNVGNYRVVVTNAAGTAISSTATLAIHSDALLNGNFEAGSGANADNWTKFGSVNRETWAQNTNGPAGYGMAFQWWVPPGAGGFYQDVAITAGKTVSLGVWAQDDAASVGVSEYSMKLEWLDSTLTNIISTDSNFISGAVSSAFNQLTLTALAPVGTVMVRVVFEGNLLLSGETLKLDDVTLTIVGSPIITNQPVSQTVFAGANVAFAVGVSNSAGASYQWQLNNVNLADGGNISGATSPTLNITGVTTGNVGNYRVVVTNVAGTAISATAALAIHSTALLNGDFEAGIGGSATGWTKFGAVNREPWAAHSDGQGMAFEWWVGASGGFYQDVAVNAGDSISLSAWFQNDQPAVTRTDYSMKLEWLDNTLANIISTESNYISGALNNVWQQFSMTHTAPAGTVLVRVVFEAGGMEEIGPGLNEVLKIDEVTLTLPGGPAITNQPVHRTVSAGANATFTVGVSNLTGATFQWQLDNVSLVNGGSVSGATSQTLAITGVAAGNVGHYRVRVTNGFGTTTSADGTLQIVGINISGANPVISIQGKPGDTNVVQYSTALTPATWIPLSTTVLTSSPELVTDPSAMGATRFYRVLYQP
jgi:hypothetical protein